MFATLLESRRYVARSLAGGACSLTAHASLVVLVVLGTGRADGDGAHDRSAGRPRMESLRWVARVPVPGAGAPGARPGRAATRRAQTGAAASPRAALPALPMLSAQATAALLDAALPADVGADYAARLTHADDFVSTVGDAGRRAAAALLASRPAGQPFWESEVQLLPAPITTNPRPAYPPSLLAMRVEGEVLVQFVVDSTGVADARSLRVLRSSHELFTRAVRRTLPRMRFLPAEIASRRVGVVVTQPYHFRVREYD